MRKLLIVLAWAVASVCVLFIVSLPINLQAHLIAGTIVLVIMMGLKFLRPEGNWRLVALAFGTAIVMRYVYWRTTSTLPPVSQLENFIPGLLLYLAEMYSVFMLALSLFIVAKPLPPRQASPIADDLLRCRPTSCPTVRAEPLSAAAIRRRSSHSTRGVNTRRSESISWCCAAMPI
jgi:cellulose synthase (UDP-forming)